MKDDFLMIFFKTNAISKPKLDKDYLKKKKKKKKK